LEAASLSDCGVWPGVVVWKKGPKIRGAGGWTAKNLAVSARAWLGLEKDRGLQQFDAAAGP